MLYFKFSLNLKQNLADEILNRINRVRPVAMVFISECLTTSNASGWNSSDGYCAPNTSYVFSFDTLDGYTQIQGTTAASFPLVPGKVYTYKTASLLPSTDQAYSKMDMAEIM